MKAKISVMIFLLLSMFVFTACNSIQKNATEIQDKYAKNDKGEPTRSFTSAELQAAEKALQNGVKIDDQQNDFTPFCSAFSAAYNSADVKLLVGSPLPFFAYLSCISVAFLWFELHAVNTIINKTRKIIT